MSSVSVIIAAYNSENTISETILSVLSQTFFDLEVIVIDDGSSDKTCQCVLEIQDNRVKLFPYENGGVAKARNRGIAHASGKYISFLDHDDLWTPDKLEAQVAALEKSPHAGVAYSWTISMYSDENPIRFIKSPPVNFEGNVYPQILLRNFIESGSNILVRTKVVKDVGEFDSVPISNEDWDFYIRLATKTQFVAVPQYQIIYRHTANSMSSQVQRLKEGGIILADKTFGSAPTNLQHLKNQFLCNHCIYCSQLYLEHFNNAEELNDNRELKKAYQAFIMAVRFFPKVLSQKTGVELLFKILLTSILSPKLIKQLKKAKRQYFASNT